MTDTLSASRFSPDETAANAKRREAYLGALKFTFHGFIIERSAKACTREATKALWQAAKYRAATYVFNLNTKNL